MDTPQSWVEALNINPEKLHEWSSAAPSGKPLLVWCLEQGHVSVSEYLQWASDAWGLAILSSAFFEDGAMDRKFFTAQKRRDEWSPWMFPVSEWDGTLFVACVELPPVDARPANISYLLADPRAMFDAWEATSHGRVVPPLPDEATTPPPLDAPVGVTLETKTKPFRLNLDEANLMGTHEIKIKAPPPLDLPPPREELAAQEELEDEPTVVAPTSAKPPEHMTTLEIDDEPLPDVGDEPVRNDTLSIPVEDKTALIAADDQTSERTIEYSPPTALHRVTPKGNPLNLPNNEAGALFEVFSTLNHVYTHSCVVRFGADGVGRLYKWAPTLTPPQNGKGAAIDLNAPSFLRIVAKTFLPYHGYLVDSPAHKQFFAGMGLTELPGCVTAAPLKVNGSLWGVVLGLGPESLQAMDNLNVVVSATEQLITAIGPLLSRAS